MFYHLTFQVLTVIPMCQIEEVDGGVETKAGMVQHQGNVSQ